MNILAVAPHPDDETFGCGGALLKHKEKGDKIFWLMMTSMKEDVGYSKKQIKKRQAEIQAVKKAYKFDQVFELDIASTKMDSMPISDLISRTRNIIDKVKPNVIYLPFQNDIHSDHRVSFKVVLNCAKTFRFPYVKKILMMEVMSETDFVPSQGAHGFLPNYFVNIDKYIEKKLNILKIYENELDERPFPRNIENIRALAILRGSTANCLYAEGFMLLKEIW